jgi:UDP-N-acetylmuramoyl-tripeptide--D-alanyl-D-alanine ligase
MSGQLVVVPDPVQAMGKLAAWYRGQFAAQVIGVVGSNGKTTTKGLIDAVLRSKKKGQAAHASFNNAIGVPLTLLSVEPPDEYVVVEIGTNHPGEIAALARIAKPDLAVVTSIGEEHLEFFGDVESVAKEEFSLIPFMRSRGFVAMSDQAARFAPPDALRDSTTLTYGLDEGADLRATEVIADQTGQTFKVNGRFDYRLPLPGRHNVVNALAAVAVGTRFRLTHEEIADALLDAELPPMRTQRIELGDITVINDAYNANPDSVRAAFAVMDDIADGGRTVLILGEMRELGEQAARCHQAVGREAGRSTAQVVIAVGGHARVLADGATATAGTTKRIHSFPTVTALCDRIASIMQPGDTVLLKASRGFRLEQLVDHLRETFGSTLVK